jgi:hypothetical protein
MPEIVDIPIADLLFHAENPRFAAEPKTQQQAAADLAEAQEEDIVRLASDIAENGLDPLSLPAAIATGDVRNRYTLLEGNRRLLAIRALETPTLISGALPTDASRKRLNELSRKYAQSPLQVMKCVLFEREADALRWIKLRHTGSNAGVGLDSWGSDEQDRFRARHEGKRKPAGQVIDFVDRAGLLSQAAQTSRKGILTNVERLVETTSVRDLLGIDLVNGDVTSYYPAEEVSKGLTRIVEDLKTDKVSVPDLYHAEQRRKYIADFPRSALPKKSSRLDEPVLLADLATSRRKPRKAPKPSRKRNRRGGRTTVIPKPGTLNVTTPRVNNVYNELLAISAEQYPNACSVLLRVFIELSVDHWLEDQKLMTEKKMRETPLAKRLRTVADHLKKTGSISGALKKAVDHVSSGASPLAAGMPTFNQYTHNRHVFPRAAELYAAWDELSPFMEKIWPE